MRNWVHWLVNHRMKWAIYVLMIVSFPFMAMFGFWLDCFEHYRYTWKSVRNLKKVSK